MAQLSDSVGRPQVTVAPHVELSAQAVRLLGQLAQTGASLSVTTTAKEQEAEFPALSETVNALMVVPTGKLEFEIKPAVCIVEVFGQLSVPMGAA